MESADRVDDTGQQDARATRFFGSVAAFIDTTYRPRTVLEFGSGVGIMRALRERGIEAQSMDWSSIDQIADTYDLITCLEVVQHLSDDVAERAIDDLTRHTARILFSSTPDNVVDPSHVNVQPPDAWVRAFGDRGFLPTATMATLLVSPHAIVFERREPAIVEELGAYELVRYRLARDLEAAQSDRERIRASLTQDLETIRIEHALTLAELASLEARVREVELGASDRREAADRAISSLQARLVAAELAVTKLSGELDRIHRSTWWRLGRPIRASFTFVRTHVPHPRSNTPPMTIPPRILPTPPPKVPEPPSLDTADVDDAVPEAISSAALVDEVVADQLPLLRPLAVFPTPNDGLRHLTVVTESLGPGSMIDGVGTSMVLAVLIALRLNASLRFVTSGEHPDPPGFEAVLHAHQVDWDANVEFSYTPFGSVGSSLAYRSGEVFMTTSLQGTWAVSRSVDPKRIVYVLQDDERAHCPAGDIQAAWNEVLADSRIRFAVDTSLLCDYLVAEGFDNLAENDVAFEPAFPGSTYFHEARRLEDRRRFFFYARRKESPDLVARGLEAIEHAVAQGILDPEEWEVHLGGSGIPPDAASNGATAFVCEDLRWADYAALIRGVDVGLSLRNSAHPGYPTLAVAACGGVAVTNRFGPKQTLDQYSGNILCVELSLSALVEGIAAAVRLAENEPTRAFNCESQQLSRAWRPSIEPVVERLIRDL